MHCQSQNQIEFSFWIGPAQAAMAVVLAGALLTPAAAAEPSGQLSKALSYKPRQEDVQYEQVTREEMENCSIEEVARADGKGFLVAGPGGQPLRWFADTNEDNRLDRWSYYDAGVEVYRELDTDFNGTADEYRWLSTQGLRWGIDRDEDGEIDAWNMISAEEVTAEVVRAAASGDDERFSRLLINEAEIQSLGLGQEKVELLEQRVADAREQFAAWAGGQNVVTSKSRWTNFGADKPGIVPAGTDGSEKDVVVYENVVALLEDNGEAKQLLVGTMIQVGATWRLMDLPKAVSDGSVISSSGMFFSASFSPRNPAAAENSVGISKAMERLVTDLQEVDAQLQAGEADPAVLQARRADVLEKLISASASAQERETWIHQFADTVSAAAQTGEYPGGVRRLRDFIKKLPSVDATNDDVAYVVFRTLTADHNQKMQDPEADYDQDDYERLQKDYLADLESFVRKYPRSDDSSEAMIQIALSAEFSGDIKTAEKWYSQASAGGDSTLASRKAAGALRRLKLVGKKFQLQGKTLDGRAFNSTSYLGGPVVYHCWASWCDGCKAEMRALKELQAKYANTKLRIVGINLDNSADLGSEFLKGSPFPWVHLFYEGSLDSQLAVVYGILTLPVNVIVDKKGQVVETGVHWTELDGVLEGLVR